MTNSQLLSKVDKVFNHIVSRSGNRPERPRKKRRLNSDAEPRGGFIIEDAGGFIPEDPQSTSDASEPREESDTIPLLSIPDALQLLDLPPDDPEVLSVFRNAASGWSNRTVGSSEEIDGREVTRADFRSVCLVLLGDGNDIKDDAMDAEEEMTAPPEATEDSDGASDNYEESSLSPISDDDDDDNYEEDYNPTAKSKSKSRKKKGHDESDSDFDFSAPRRLTARQKDVCLDAFQLFFPSVNSDELPNQRIYLKDLIRVAESLKERVKSDDVKLFKRYLHYC